MFRKLAQCALIIFIPCVISACGSGSSNSSSGNSSGSAEGGTDLVLPQQLEVVTHEG